MESVLIRLLDKNGEVQYGLNWGHRESRDKNQSYIQLPTTVYKSDFFPKKGTYFLVSTDDGEIFAMNRAQKNDDGTAIQTPENNAILGKYIRNRLGLADGKEISLSDILSYGRIDLEVWKVDNRHYLLDYSTAWKNNNLQYLYEMYLYLEYYKMEDGKLPIDKIKTELSTPFPVELVSYENGKFRLNEDHVEIPESLTNFLSSDFLYKHYSTNKISNTMFESGHVPHQLILYGAPGTGKSHRINEEYIGNGKSFRITFHPDTDYASFVGCYKPTMGGDKGNEITYAFVPQVFLKAYVYAWNNPNKKTYLVIEELNRGNCAQIFGDVFQLLDRQVDNYPGFSKYTINADADIARYLEKTIKNEENSYINKIKNIYNLEEFDFSVMAIPDNLYILATMNTSDQSLFPIDSAFKRRWNMEYVPVSYSDASQFSLVIDTKHKYNWATVLKGLNDYIKAETHSTNKVLGNRFVQVRGNKTIDAESFRDKVLFFLFNDVFKDNDDFTQAFFGDEAENKFFEDLCETKDNTLVIKFIEGICNAENSCKEEESSKETTEPIS